MHRGFVHAARLALSLCVLAGCDDDESGMLDGGVMVDGSTADASMLDGGPVRSDAGPVIIADAGTCDTWGIDEDEAITGANAESWTFVPFPEAHCMNGSSTGIGVKLSPTGDSRVVIYLEGGGACFDAITCTAVAGVDGFGADHLASGASRLDRYGIFRRDESNPMRDWNFVYVPYCSGDAHTGTVREGFEGREQIGFLNVATYLRRLVPTFRDAEQVLLAGASAGGLGAIANYDQVQQAFGCTPVDLLDDSGPVLDDAYLRPCLQRLVRERWGMMPPADCGPCAAEDGGGLSALWTYLALKYPERRFGLLSSTADQTFRTFYGYGLSARCNLPQIMPAELYEEAVLQLRDEIFAPHDNLRAFYTPGEGHTYISGSLSGSTADGVTLGTWIGQLIDGAPAWSNVGP